MSEKLNIEKLMETIFNMLNYANMYILILDEKMEIKFINQGLAIDLGLESYENGIGRCWLDFLIEEEKKLVTTVHKKVASGIDYMKYQEFQNKIISKDGLVIDVSWLNAHINTNYNWSFSFGIRKEPETRISMESIRGYYKDIIEKDRTMINAVRDMILSRDRIIDSCEPSEFK